MLQHLLIIWLSIFHPFYVSVTEIEQNQQTKTVQVSVRIFFDDLERAVDKRYKTSINILKPKDRKQVEGFIAAYVKERLKIKANGTALTLKFVGYEIEEEAAWCYFETDKLPIIQQLNVQNNILFEQHESQINMIHATVKGKRKSTKLDNPSSLAEFKYQD
ncbi:MAG: hypothetical protein EOO92_03675 [Pedobacter sp.]|nr:MAG: hypothetical protein EOO92_03675 [Pedobacter sp.]